MNSHTFCTDKCIFSSILDGTHRIILVSSNKYPSTNASLIVQFLLGGLDEEAAAAAGAWPLLKANEVSHATTAALLSLLQRAAVNRQRD